LKDLEKISDAELAFHVKNGEKLAYQVLFERFTPRIYQFALSYLKNEADAEELIQNVFLIIWEKRESIDGTQNVKAYIFKITVNCIYDYIRRRNIERAFNDYARLNFTRSSENTWHQVIYEEMMDTLEKMVSELPEQRRKIFLLSKRTGLNNNEIALHLNISIRTVENQLYRAVSYLKAHFKDEP